MKAKEARGVNQEIRAHRKGNLKTDIAVKYYVKLAHCYLNVNNRLGNSLKRYQAFLCIQAQVMHFPLPRNTLGPLNS